jgi:hypothetical protein
VEHETHTYRPSPWYLLLALAAAFGVLVIINVVHRLATSTFVIVPLATVLAIGFTMTLKLDPEGVDFVGRRASWDQLRTKRTIFGPALRTTRGTPLRKKLQVAPAIFDLRWRTGPIGADIARWAPHLYEQLR